MFFLLGSDKKSSAREKKGQKMQNFDEARDMFLSGKFPVVTTSQIEGRRIVKVLGLVCCRGYDSDETFFGMASRAMSKGAQAIIGYNENVAFHPDGSKYFSCYGTAVMFDYDPDDPDAMPFMLQKSRTQRSMDALI